MRVQADSLIFHDNYFHNFVKIADKIGNAYNRESSDLKEQAANSPVDEAYLNEKYTELLNSMEETVKKDGNSKMGPVLAQTFIALENLHPRTHDRRYKKLYSLAKMYVEARGFENASQDLVNRVMPRIQM